MKPVIFMSNVSALEDTKLFAGLYGLMDQERRDKVDSCHFGRDKRLSLGVGALLEYARRQYGRDICYNLSHSGEAAMCAAGDEPLGCDVERYREAAPNGKNDRIERIAGKFFYNTEYETILKQPDEEARRDMFYRLWTLKESYMKLTKLGFALPLDKFEIGLGEKISVKVAPGYPALKTSFFEYDYEPGYSCSLAVSDYEGEKPELIRVDLRKILL